MVLYKQSYRPGHDCIYYFNLQLTQHANLVFHQSSSDALVLYDNMPASALEKIATFAGDVLFDSKPLTSIKPEATLERIDFRISGQPEVPHTKDEKAEKTFLISSLTKTCLRLAKQFDVDC